MGGPSSAPEGQVAIGRSTGRIDYSKVDVWELGGLGGGAFIALQISAHQCNFILH